MKSPDTSKLMLKNISDLTVNYKDAKFKIKIYFCTLVVSTAYLEVWDYILQNKLSSCITHLSADLIFILQLVRKKSHAFEL